jgi:hypothetical protein
MTDLPQTSPTTTAFDSRQLSIALRAPAAAFTLERGVERQPFASETLFREACAADPLLFGLLALAPEVRPAQQARALYVLLESGRTEDEPTRQLLHRVAKALVLLCGPQQTFAVGLALRRARVNRKLATRTLVWALLAGPEAAAVTRECPRLSRAVLEHAVGRDVARACGKAATDQAYRRENLLRYVESAKHAQATELMLGLYASADESTDQDEKLASELTIADRTSNDHDERNEPFASRLKEAVDQAADMPKTVTATNRGEISATLYHMLRGGKTDELQRGLSEQIERAASSLAPFRGHIALVLDGSASMASYGSRKWAAWAQSLAFSSVLAKCCDKLSVFGHRLQLEDASELPRPSGPSDLALPLCEALRSEPDIVLILTDGYENQHFGDLDRVLAAKERIGNDTPVLLGLCTFTSFDEVQQKLPTSRVPWMRIWHQAQLERLQLELSVMTNSDAGLAALREYMLMQLTRIEQAIASL